MATNKYFEIVDLDDETCIFTNELNVFSGQTHFLKFSSRVVNSHLHYKTETGTHFYVYPAVAALRLNRCWSQPVAILLPVLRTFFFPGSTINGKKR